MTRRNLGTTTAAIAALAIALFACNTVSKGSLPGIDVPPGLTSSEIEFAILATLADQPPPEGLSPELEVTDRALKAWFGGRYQSAQKEHDRWFLEGRSSNRVHAGIQRGQHYLRVGIVYSPSRIDFEIEDSRELRESRRSIHQAAARWIQDLEIQLRRSLGRLSAL